MTKDDVRVLADEVLRPILGPVGFTSSDVREKPDHDGEDSLYVDVHFSPDAMVVKGRIYLDAQIAVVQALTERGEHRFPYLRYAYLDDSPEVEEEDRHWLRP